MQVFERVLPPSERQASAQGRRSAAQGMVCGTLLPEAAWSRPRMARFAGRCLWERELEGHNALHTTELLVLQWVLRTLVAEAAAAARIPQDSLRRELAKLALT